VPPPRPHLDFSGARDVVSVAVGVGGLDQLEAQIINNLYVPLDLRARRPD
jgi:hypothetical protein